MGTIKAISISDRKGMRKKNIETTRLLVESGLEHDAHAGRWHRQVSFLAEESIEKMRDKGLDVVAGNFAENITTEGLDLVNIGVGTHITLGETELILSQLGKICHTRCAIYHQAGDCVMPKEGVFGVVVKGGDIHVGDTIHVLKKRSTSAAIITSKETEQTHADPLRQLASAAFHPAFIRFDVLNNKEGGNLAAILKDLTTTQQTDDIIIFDPSGSEGLALIGYSKLPGSDNRYGENGSTIHYCRTIEEVKQL